MFGVSLQVFNLSCAFARNSLLRVVSLLEGVTGSPCCNLCALQLFLATGMMLCPRKINEMRHENDRLV